uniref:NADH dehydrogenase subunit 2 n=1 Tax=Parasitus fimetorum TaxID=2022322 RepID=UPI001FAEA73E|nr:NADH dehydrogenase subunit 2 [Parasitus fimetorum]UKO33182.1 NADH dehydrogenase subunit 2 [Parasitus fimetorum]
MFYSMNMLFFIILIISTMFALSSDSWFQLWASLEINMMVFIPLMFNKNNISINSMMKYFLIQAFASSIFIFMMLMSQTFMWEFLYSNFITLAMSMKLGLFPVYFWFPQVSEGLTWTSFTLLSTWQKVIPMYVMASSSHQILPIIIIFSALIGCLSMINQTSLRKLFAYSSLTHMSWMSLCMINANNGWMNYLIVYILIMISIYFIFKSMNSSTIDNIKFMYNKTQTLTLLITMMSLGGLPPFLGFFPKWMVISNTPMYNFFIMFILIISSLISIFIYLRILYPLLFTKFINTKKTSSFNSTLPITLNMIMLIPIMPLIFF